MRYAFLATVVALALTPAAPARASCRVMQFDFTPTDGLQMVIWLEDANGTFVDTLFITRTTGTYGLGNRPGRFDFNSEFLWPYGRRDSLFPVWAHRRGVEYPRVVFQDGDDSDLSHAITQSSSESYYCRPLRVGETTWNVSVDAGSCATPTYTDKGQFSATEFSRYPPRSDLSFAEGIDSIDSTMFAAMNDLDAVSRATPAGGAPYTMRFSVPDNLPDGEYTAYIEVAKEFDQNASYDFPSPTGIPWSEYGEPYRGQPSVVWQVPVRLQVGAGTQVTKAVGYAGYGDPTGLTGDLNPPDGTISTTVEGSGAGRLLLVQVPEAIADPATGEKVGLYRFRASAGASDDDNPPEPPGQLSATSVTHDAASLRFAAPADDGLAVTAYQVRYLIGEQLTAANFTTAGIPTAEGMPVLPPGALQTFTLGVPLAPETHYWVGVRALDQCLNPGPIAIVDFVTAAVPVGEVDACFVATAAFGSPLAADVSLLRRFRDQALRSQALGELFVATYYTFGPAFAEAIEPSDTLRALTRDALAPVVDLAKTLVDPL